MGKYLRFLPLILVLGCNEEPVGWEELGRDTGPPQVVKLLPEAQGCYGKHIPLGEGANLIWGEDGEYRAHTLIQFQLPDTTIEAARFWLKLTNELCDSGLAFQIYPITAPWNEYQATWLLATSATRWKRPGGDYDSAALCSGVLGRDSLMLDFSTAQIERLKAPDCRGILLKTAGEGFGACRSANTSTPPKLIIKYGDKTDTIAAGQDAYLVDTLGISPKNELWVGSGFAYRTWLCYDLSEIPSDAVMIAAELGIGIDEVLARSDTLKLGVYALTREFDGPYTEYGLYPWATSRFDIADTMVSLELRALAQSWVVKPDSNFGLLLMIEPEGNELARVALKSEPLELELIYLLPPEGRFMDEGD